MAGNSGYDALLNPPHNPPAWTRIGSLHAEVSAHTQPVVTCPFMSGSPVLNCNLDKHSIPSFSCWLHCIIHSPFKRGDRYQRPSFFMAKQLHLNNAALGAWRKRRVINTVDRALNTSGLFFARRRQQTPINRSTSSVPPKR